MARSYAEKLKDPRWQKARLEILERDDFTCTRCGSKDKTLHVHHGYYERGKDLWEYDPGTLWTYCEDCHQHVGAITTAIHRDIGYLGPLNLEMLSDILSVVYADELLQIGVIKDHVQVEDPRHGHQGGLTPDGPTTVVE